MKTELQEIQSFLEINISDDINEVIERGNQLQVYMARTAYLIAESKKNLAKKKKDEAMEVVENVISEMKLSAKVQNTLMDGLCAEEQYILSWCERLNATCTHQLDWCRSLLSKAKEEMKLMGISREFK